MEETHIRSVHEEQQHVEGLKLKKLMEHCVPWEGPHAGAGDDCEKSYP